MLCGRRNLGVLGVLLCCTGGASFSLSPSCCLSSRALSKAIRGQDFRENGGRVSVSISSLSAQLQNDHTTQQKTPSDRAKVIHDRNDILQRRAVVSKAAATLPLVLAGFPEKGWSADKDLVLVLGATGPIGQYVSRELMSRGYKVRGVTRYQEEAKRVLGSKVEWVSADLNDAGSLAAVIPGVSQVIFAAGAHGWEDLENNRRIYGEAVAELARLSAKQGVKKFVLISSGGVTQQGARRSKYLTDVLYWKLKGEELLKTSGVPYAIVRAYSLAKEKTTEVNATSELLLFQGDRIDVGGLISRHDLAVVAVEAMENSPPKTSLEVFAKDLQYYECDKGTCLGLVCHSLDLPQEPLSRAPECDRDWRPALRALRQDPLSS